MGALGGLLWIVGGVWWAVGLKSTGLVAGLGLLWGMAGWALYAASRLKMRHKYHRLEDAHIALQRLIDVSDVGLLAVNPDGELRRAWSLSVARWFGRPAREKVWDYLFPHDESLRSELELCLKSIRDHNMPLESAIARMPVTFVREGRTYRFSVKRARYAGDDHIVLVLRDISRRVVIEQADRARREFQTIIGNLVKDSSSAQDFLQSMHQQFAALMNTGGDAAAFFSTLHTIKGQAALFGFSDFAEQCHQQEVELMAAGAMPAERGMTAQALWSGWRQTLASIESVVEDRTSDIIEADTRAYEAALERLEDRRARANLVEMVRESRLEETSRQLVYISDQAKRLASWVGKSVEVEVKDNGVRIAMDGFQVFWASLTHVIRNAVDHGIESSEERARLGKEERGRLLLETQWDRETLYVTVEDDGRGIDWEAIREKAEHCGLPASSQQELIQALCAEGVTSRKEVGVLSGRGQGMSDVKQSCEALGGRFRVLTTVGQGTRFEFLFPQPA